MNTKLEMFSGTSQTFDLVVKANGITPNITGWTFSFEAQSGALGTDPVIFAVPDAGFTITDAPNGKVRLTIEPATTTALLLVKDTLFFFEVWGEEPSTAVHRLAYGTLRVNISLAYGNSYSTPAKLAKRISPRLYAGLTGDNVTPNDEVAQTALNNAAKEINRRLRGQRSPTDPYPPDQLAVLEGMEEQIAIWFLFVYRGFDSTDASAAAAKIGYDAVMGDLSKMAAQEGLALPGVQPIITFVPQGDFDNSFNSGELP